MSSIYNYKQKEYGTMVVSETLQGSHAGQLLRLCVPCPDSTREEGILHGYCSGVWWKEPDGASWNEERFWWYINKVVYDLK
jgi:hypothetical protein